jgi:hypothetical protein
MSNVLLKAAIIFTLIIASIFATYSIHPSYAAPGFVTVTSSSEGGKTILSVSNSVSNTADIISFILQINGEGTFKSFKIEGWQGVKTAPNTLTFSAINPLKPGNTISIEIKTDQQSPVMSWKSSDANGQDKESGQIGIQQSENNPGSTPTQQSKNNPDGTKTQPENKQGSTPTQQTNQPHTGILDSSTFRIIPSTPAPGSHIRVLGYGFSSSSNLDLYIGNDRIDSFSSNDRGNFVTTVVLPQSEPPGAATFILKDQAGNQKSFSTNIRPQSKTSHGGVIIEVPLTLNIDPIYHRGDTKTISGTATPGTTVTLTLYDSKGNPITTSAVQADNDGKYSMKDSVPIDRDFGKYSVTASDGKGQVTKQYSIVTTHSVSVTTTAQRYERGQTLVVNGTSISNQPVDFTILDSTGQQVYSKTENVTAKGTVTTSYKIPDSAIKGTYTINITQGNDLVVVFVGIGEDRAPPITASLDKLSYQNTDKPVIRVTGPSTSVLNLVIVDPSDKQKFADLINLGSDGQATYSFNLTSYTPGIYSVVVSHAEEKIEKEFAVGLVTGPGLIKLSTVKDAYMPGDNIIIIGTANPNSLLQLSLTDPNGFIIKSLQTFSDKTGHFSSFDFKIPSVSTPGIWKLDASSGVSHKSMQLIVKSSKQGIIVHLDRPSGIYSRGDMITISGTDAGVTAPVSITIGSNSTNLDTLPTSSTNRGDYTTIWQVPRNVNPGQYIITATSITGKATIGITIQ